MFSHIVLGADDIPAAKKFYDAALGALGHDSGNETPDGNRVIYQAETGILMITRPLNGDAATFANGGTIGLAAPSPEAGFSRPGNRRRRYRRGRPRPPRRHPRQLCGVPAGSHRQQAGGLVHEGGLSRHGHGATGSAPSTGRSPAMKTG